MYRMTRFIEPLLLAFWVGGTWTIGYLVAPTLFATLDDRQLAGMLAGRMFDGIMLLGAICGGLLLAVACAHHGSRSLKAWRVWVLLAMLLMIAVIELWVRPQMVDLKAQGLFGNARLAAEFAKLHSISSVCYLVLSLLGIPLVIKGVSPSAVR